MGKYTPEQAREALLEKAKYLEPCWIDTELLTTSKRRREEYDRKQEAEKAAARARAAEVRSLADLPDEDLQWLLDMGWSPFDT